MPVTVEFVAGSAWEHHTFTFEDFGIEGHDFTGIFFGGGSEAGEFVLWIDEVRLD